MDPGVWMRTTFAFLASGPIYIEQWIQQVTRLISYSLLNATPLQPIEELKQARELGRRCRCRLVRYLNNVVEQDHRVIKRRLRATQGFRSLESAWRTIQGIETVNMIRKGRIRWLPKHDILGQAAFVIGLFGVMNGTARWPSGDCLPSSIASGDMMASGGFAPFGPCPYSMSTGTCGNGWEFIKISPRNAIF